MSFAWSGVEFVGDQVAIGLGDTLHGVSFLEVLADQSIGIFVRTTFPGVVRCGEVAGDWVGGFNAGVVVEF